MNKQDLVDGKVTQREYYLDVAKGLGHVFTKNTARYIVSRKLQDRVVKGYMDKALAFQVFRDRGDVWSTHGHRVALNYALIDTIERET